MEPIKNKKLYEVTFDRLENNYSNKANEHFDLSESMFNEFTFQQSIARVCFKQYKQN
jgi:hypothetical protein